MNKKIYTGYELIKALADEEIKVGTTLLFTNLIDSTKKIEAQVDRCPEGLILYKKNSLNETLPGSWFLSSKIEILEDNTENIEEIEEIEIRPYKGIDYNFQLIENNLHKLAKAVNEIRKDLNK